MGIDFAVPENNEGEFIKIATKLGVKKLYFLYDFEDYEDSKIPELSRGKVDTEAALIVSHKNLDKAAKTNKMLVAKSSENDRALIESKKIKIIYGLEGIEKRDGLHHRASGLNHVLCELASKNNVAVGFAYSSLLNKSNQEISLIMGRMMQNIALCQKYKVKMVLASFSKNPFEIRARHDATSLFSMLGKNKNGLREHP